MSAVSNPAFSGIQLEPVDGGEAGQVSRNDADTDAPSSLGRSSWFFCCAKKEGGGSCATILFIWYTRLSTVLDVTDGVLDYVHVAELAQHQETRKHAAWLGVCTTIALFLELVVKTKLRWVKDESTAQGNYGNFDMKEKQERNKYIAISGMMELVIFLVEDATTVFVWWQTGTYDADSPVAQANLITTVVSAAGAATVGLYGFIRLARSSDDWSWCNSDSDGGLGAQIFVCILMIPTALFVVTLVFWAVVALNTIQGGERYACIGSCVTTNATTTDTTTLLAGSDALVFGSGSSFGSGESGAGEGGNDVGLNRTVIGMYVVGWIVAVLGGCLTSCGAFTPDSS